MSIKLCEPNVKSNPSAFPPSNASPSINPSKSIFATSFNSAVASASTSFNLAAPSFNLSISAFTFSSVISKVSFSTSTPLYSPKVIAGNTGITNTTSTVPSLFSYFSNLGSAIGLNSFSTTAFWYSSEII